MAVSEPVYVFICIACSPKTTISVDIISPGYMDAYPDYANLSWPVSVQTGCQVSGKIYQLYYICKMRAHST